MVPGLMVASIYVKSISDVYIDLIKMLCYYYVKKLVNIQLYYIL